MGHCIKTPATKVIDMSVVVLIRDLNEVLLLVSYSWNQQKFWKK